MSETQTRNKCNNLPENSEFVKQVESLIRQGGFSVLKFAQSNNFNPSELRSFISKSFGQSVIFKRGRNGGVFWNETK